MPRLRPLTTLARDTEILNLPDGDFVELAWVRPAPMHEDAPVFVLFHGLEGGFDSPMPERYWQPPVRWAGEQ
ncbi:hypothetical protein [Modicisalibacter luteus]|uniref:hypothetical protein n=1 Tax=Modicisalibacter luteus TaxID=453962 RepID=UPI00363C8721